MTSFLPAELKTKLKEGLRDARFVAREMRPRGLWADSMSGPERGEPDAKAGLTVTLSEFSDSALQKLETMAIGLLSSDPGAHFDGARVYPLDRYARTGQLSTQALFARDCYFSAKQILRAKNCANPRVSEQRFSHAYRLAAKEWTMSATHWQAAQENTVDDIALAAAILAQALIRARPIHAPETFNGEAGGRPVNAALYMGCALGLAFGVATFHARSLGADDSVYLGVCAAVDARYAAMEKAVAESAGPERLARVFADLIPHLP